LAFQYFIEPDNPEIPRGPANWARDLWIEEMPYAVRKQRGHFHHQDIAICIGAAGSGKSMNAGSRGIHLARKWKNGKLVIGAMNRPQLDRNQIQYWASIYGMNGNGQPWGHKEIALKMTDKRQWNVHSNGTMVYFLNFDLWHTVQGIAAGFILVEEANNLKSIQSYYALLSRFRTMSMPLWQMVLLANPRLQHNWMLDAFDLRQFMPGYRGPKKPIGKPCNCQFCPACIQFDKIEVEWIDDECPRCGVVNNRAPKIRYCRNCRAIKKKLVKYDGAQCPDCGWYKCPGEQYFHRLIHSTLKDNQFADETMEQNMRSTMSAVQFKLLGEGQILDTNTGTIHISWNESNNVLPANINMDMDRDIHWCQDFNNDPMTTVLAQVYNHDGEPNIYVIDELILFRSTVQDSVNAFIEKYGEYRGKVIIWGDPAGYVGSIKDKVLDRYEQICQAFDQAGINYELRAVNTPMPIQSRLDTLTYHLADARGYTRLFFNPQATWTIASVRGVIWNKQGNKEDETCDRQVAELARLGEIPPGQPGPDVPVKPLTHPQAALGYWLNLEYPQVQWAEPVTWHKEPDGTIVEFRRDEMVIKRPGDGYAPDLENFNPSRHSLEGMMSDMDEDPATLWSDIRDDGNHFWPGWSP
jgi:hypothetical protein